MGDALKLQNFLTWLPLLAAIMGQLTMNMTVFLGHTHTSESISTNGTTGLGVVFFNLSLVLYLPLWALVLVIYHSEKRVNEIAVNAAVQPSYKSVTTVQSMGTCQLRNRRYIYSAEARSGEVDSGGNIGCHAPCRTEACCMSCQTWMKDAIKAAGHSTWGVLNLHEIIAIVNTIAYALIVCFPVDEYKIPHLTFAATYFVTLYFHLCFSIWSPAIKCYNGYFGVRILRIFVFVCATFTGFGLFLGMVAVKWFFPVYEVTGSMCVSIYIALFSVEFHNVFESLEIVVLRKDDEHHEHAKNLSTEVETVSINTLAINKKGALFQSDSYENDVKVALKF
jgi:hypothetical protein